MKDKVRFDVAVAQIVKADKRFEPGGYQFLREALEHTIAKLRKDELLEHRQVSGPELLDGVVEHALSEFGSMAAAVLDSWGIRSGEDIGEMVFALIEAGAFGRSEDDSPADFHGVIDLRRRLLSPYRPSRPVLSPRRSGGSAEPPSRGNQPAKSSES
ncbi:MAG: Minf_1886 family protein [Verrucomicrobiales bacterium]